MEFFTSDFLLPPHWSKVSDEDKVYYKNEITGDSSMIHPYHQYLMLSNPLNEKQLTPLPLPSSSTNIEKLENTHYDTIINSESIISKQRKYFDFYSNWTERDINGKELQYGLTLRLFPDSSIQIKFTGVESEWNFTSLKGPYGAITIHDLFIGSRVSIFGKSVTINSSSLLASKYLHSEAVKLLKQQEKYQLKIESIGIKPCIKKKDYKTLLQTKLLTKLNLRQLLKENAKLGEQLSILGLANTL